MKKALCILLAVWTAVQSFAAPFPFCFFKTLASAGGTLLLDEPTLGSAAVAFSVNKLRSAYSGDALRVRRSSDNAECDVEFLNGWVSLDSPINNLSAGSGATLTAWAGSDSCYTVTWFDQSGNARDATQATSSKQPMIVSAGALVTGAGSKPALNLVYTATQGFTFTATSISGSAFTWFAVGQHTNRGSSCVMFFADKLSGYAENGGKWGVYNNADVKSSYTPSTNSLMISVSRAANDVDFYTNGNSVETKTTGSSYNTRTGAIGNDSGQNMGGKIQAAVLWASTTPTPATIKANVNGAFSIY